MEIHLFDNGGHIPQPKNKIFIEALSATPYTDRRRITVKLKVTPFQERPNLILAIRDQNEKIVADADIIETMHADMEFVMHFKNINDPAGLYTLTAYLFYETKNPPQDQKTITFEILPEASENDQET